MTMVGLATDGASAPLAGLGAFAPQSVIPTSSLVQSVTASRGDAACPSPSLTPQERAAAERGDRLAFWESRNQRSDPIAPVALAIVRDQGVNGKVANGRLFNALAEREVLNGKIPDAVAIRSEMQRIGLN